MSSLYNAWCLDWIRRHRSAEWASAHHIRDSQVVLASIIGRGGYLAGYLRKTELGSIFKVFSAKHRPW